MTNIPKEISNIAEGNDDNEIAVFIKRALEGDDKAFRHIYELHSGKMYSLCKRYAGATGEEDDLFQEGYIKVYKNLSGYKGLGSFEGWVRRIFVNNCLDHLKKKKNLIFTNNLDENQELHPVVDGEKEIRLSNEDLLKIVQAIPDGYRTIVNLYCIEGYSHKEIADMLHISEGTSKSQLSKARNKLQEIIKKHNGR